MSLKAHGGEKTKINQARTPRKSKQRDLPFKTLLTPLLLPLGQKRKEKKGKKKRWDAKAKIPRKGQQNQEKKKVIKGQSPLSTKTS